MGFQTVLELEGFSVPMPKERVEALKFVMRELGKWKKLKAGQKIDGYVCLEHFEQVHGKPFMFVLEEFDELLREDYERFNKASVQQQFSAKKLRQTQ